MKSKSIFEIFKNQRAEVNYLPSYDLAKRSGKYSFVSDNHLENNDLKKTIHWA